MNKYQIITCLCIKIFKKMQIKKIKISSPGDRPLAPPPGPRHAPAGGGQVGQPFMGAPALPGAGEAVRGGGVVGAVSKAAAAAGG